MTSRISLSLSMLALVGLFFFSGCSKTPEQRVTGTWALDVDTTMTAMGDRVGEGSADTIRGMLESMAMSMTFAEDGTMTMTMNMGTERTETGTWSVTSAEGDVITLSTLEEGDEEADEVVLTFAGNDHFTMAIAADQMAFARQ